MTEVDGAEIRRRRQRRGIKPGVFADRVGLHRSTVRHIELGSRRPSPEALARIAAVLECDVSELLIHQDAGRPVSSPVPGMAGSKGETT